MPIAEAVAGVLFALGTVFLGLWLQCYGKPGSFKWFVMMAGCFIPSALLVRTYWWPWVIAHPRLTASALALLLFWTGFLARPVYEDWKARTVLRQIKRLYPAVFAAAEGARVLAMKIMLVPKTGRPTAEDWDVMINGLAASAANNPLSASLRDLRIELGLEQHARPKRQAAERAQEVFARLFYQYQLSVQHIHRFGQTIGYDFAGDPEYVRWRCQHDQKFLTALRELIEEPKFAELKRLIESPGFQESVRDAIPVRC